MALRTGDFDFDLPEELIAQRPPAQRGQSRLLVLPRHEGSIEHTSFDLLSGHLRPGDLLVLNDTRVFPARLIGRRDPSGGSVECLLLRQLPTPNSQLPSAEDWEALMHPGQKLKPGARVVFERDGVHLYGEVLARHFHGRRTIRLWTGDDRTVADAVERIGHIPLPPYIARADEASDRERYQTVYAREAGSVAAPTAGLHFTEPILDALHARGIERVSITLHVGYGTFKPVRVEQVEEHTVDPEHYTVSPSAADALTRALRAGRRVIAVGTTTTRTLESLTVDPSGLVSPSEGNTRLFIHPGHEFRVVSGLITNFHLPKSSLLMLVAAFTGKDRILAAYREAVELGYHFYSYGDAMLIL
jgi:S-adenosylmethionine:tRNA ribosyltransferase-isomerase